MTDLSNVREWRGKEVYTHDDEKLGKLEDVYYDGESGDPLMLCVRTGLLSRSQVLVPVRDVTAAPDRLTVAWSSSGVKGAPTTAPDDELSADDERLAFQHYGLEYVPPAAGGRRLVRR